VHFVRLTEVDPIYYDHAYYLVPDPASVKAYALLRDAMRVSGKAAVGHVALHEKGRLALLRSVEDAIVLETLYYADAVHPMDIFNKELPGETEPGSEELAMALRLIDRMSAKFEPAQYKDTHHERILQIIRSKIKEKEVAAAGKPEPSSSDLAEALKESLQKIY
ncbi:MAG TPA: Ku protein, partial [Nitrospiria bacterium]|nr:Ku protein [Nitrospiria bacterium]